SLASILITLVFTFHRGELFTIASITIIYIVAFSRNAVQLFSKLLGIVFLVLLFLILFRDSLHEKGYDPVEKISEIAEFSIDVNNPDWEKGRNIPIEYAISAWKENIVIGVGYNDLYHFGLPKTMAAAHNFIIASLFQRGIIGTTIYLLTLGILFGNAISLWFLLSKEKSLQNDMFRILIVVAFFWLVPAMTQDVIWEKYSLSVQFLYLGIIRNIYLQKRELMLNKDNKVVLNNKMIFKSTFFNN
ncbi:MAG TPA: O-antigen ligase family protein, partial [Chitinophagales bacterium]|nr:O-antigen ligase family protein [Chitinophagales bacterium]